MTVYSDKVIEGKLIQLAEFLCIEIWPFVDDQFTEKKLNENQFKTIIDSVQKCKRIALHAYLINKNTTPVFAIVFNPNANLIGSKNMTNHFLFKWSDKNMSKKTLEKDIEVLIPLIYSKENLEKLTKFNLDVLPIEELGKVYLQAHNTPFI